MLGALEAGRRRALVDAIDALPFSRRGYWLARLNADFVGTMHAFTAADHGADTHTGEIDATR
jgi:hypothetical protein